MPNISELLAAFADDSPIVVQPKATKPAPSKRLCGDCGFFHTRAEPCVDFLLPPRQRRIRITKRSLCRPRSQAAIRHGMIAYCTQCHRIHYGAGRTCTRPPQPKIYLTTQRPQPRFIRQVPRPYPERDRLTYIEPKRITGMVDSTLTIWGLPLRDSSSLLNRPVYRPWNSPYPIITTPSDRR